MTPVVLRLAGVTVVRCERPILDGVGWSVRPGERWVVLGPSGSGKTTLVRVAALYLHPSCGSVEVLGGALGRVDVRTHRRAIGVVSAALADSLRPTIDVLDVVITAKHAALEAWWHEYDASDRSAALASLERVAAGHLADRTFGTLS